MKVKVNLSCEIEIPKNASPEDFIVHCWNYDKPVWPGIFTNEWAMHYFDVLPDNSKFELQEQAKEMSKEL